MASPGHDWAEVFFGLAASLDLFLAVVYFGQMVSVVGLPVASLD